MEFKVGDIVEVNSGTSQGLGIVIDIEPNDFETILVKVSSYMDLYVPLEDIQLYDPTRLELALNNHLNLVD